MATATLRRLLTLLLACASVALGQTDVEVTTLGTNNGYYVDVATGSDGDDGRTFANAFATIGKAITVARAGDTVLVEPGTYAEALLNFSYDGTSSEPIVWRVRGAWTGSVLIHGHATSASYQTATMAGDYNYFEGLTFTTQNFDDTPLFSLDWTRYECMPVSGDHVTFYRSQFPTPKNGATEIDLLTVSQGANQKHLRMITVTGKYFRFIRCKGASWNMGVVVAGGSGRFTTFRRDTMLEMYQSAIDIQASADGTTNPQGILIDSCYLSTSYAEDNIQFEDGSLTEGNTALNRYIIIKDNILLGAGENAIDMKTASYVWIEGNLIQGAEGNDDGGYDGKPDNRDSGPTVERKGYIAPKIGTDHVTLRYNTIYDSHQGTTTCAAMTIMNNTIMNVRRDYNGPNRTDYEFSTIRPWAEYGPVWIYNNIFLNMPKGTGNSSLIKIPPAGGVYVSDWNQFFDSSNTGQFNKYVYPTSTFYSTLAAWQAATGHDANSDWGDPKLANTPDMAWGVNATWTFKVDSATSPCTFTGRAHALATNGGTNATVLYVDNPYAFRTAFGNPDATADVIQVGTTTAGVSITAIDYDASRITLATPRTWGIGDSVNLYYFVKGLHNPDRGAGGAPVAGTVSDPSGGVPDPPTLTAPAQGANETNSNYNTEFTWSAPTGATKYWLCATADNWLTMCVDDNTLTTNSSTKPLPNNSTIVWNVAAGNANGWSAFSSERSFTTAYTGGSSTTIQLSWNKVKHAITLSGRTTIEFTDLQRRDIDVIVSNPSGYALDWPAGIVWPSSPPPPRTTGVSTYKFLRDGTTVMGWDFTSVMPMSAIEQYVKARIKDSLSAVRSTIASLDARLTALESGGGGGGGTSTDFAVDAVSSSSGSGTSLTFAHTTSGSDRVLVVMLSVNFNTISSVTYAGTAMTPKISRDKGGFYSYSFVLSDPALGTNNVVVTPASSATMFATAVSFVNANTASPVRDNDLNYADGTSTAPSLTVSSALGDIVVNGTSWDWNEGAVTSTMNDGTTERYNDGLNYGAFCVSTSTGASSVTSSWTLSASRDWSTISLSVKPK